MKCTLKYTVTILLLLSTLECFGDQVIDDQVEVIVSATNLYKADQFILSFELYEFEDIPREEAEFNLQSTSERIWSSISDAVGKISALKSSSTLSRVAVHYNIDCGRYEFSNYHAIRHQAQFESYSDYIIAHSTLIKLGISEDFIRMTSRFHSDSEHIIQTLRDAGRLSFPKAEAIAMQNHLVLSQPLLVQTLETRVTSRYISSLDSTLKAETKSASAITSLMKDRVMLSDEIQVSVHLRVIFEGITER